MFKMLFRTDEVDFSGEPLFADFAEEGRDESEKRGFVWKEGGDAGSAFEFLIDAFDGVACAHAALVGGREGEDSEALRDIAASKCRIALASSPLLADAAPRPLSA
jgi:hypothetical protein